ncbi:MAG: hypothetical protein ACK50E_04445 [Bacteroidota bacterium]
MALSCLSVISNNQLIINPVATVAPLVSNWTLASSWLGGNIKGNYGGTISSTQMTVTGASISNFNGNYTYTNGTMYLDGTSTITTNYSGIFDGSDANKYGIPANGFCTITLTMPVKAQVKKIYHNCPTTATTITLVLRGSKDNGITWVGVASTTLSNTNRDSANVPTTLASTDKFNMFKWELTNMTATPTSIWVLDFVCDFYA